MHSFSNSKTSLRYIHTLSESVTPLDEKIEMQEIVNQLPGEIGELHGNSDDRKFYRAVDK